MQRSAFFLLLIAGLSGGSLFAQYHTYIGDVGPESVLIAWGTTKGSNTIGRSSTALGKVAVRINNGERIVADRNYAVISGLSPDTDYPYQVLLDGRKIGDGRVRTWPAQSDHLCFFSIGDYGSGDEAQLSIARAMQAEFQKHLGTDCPVRFVITTGDNLYGKLGFSFRTIHTGNEDSHWESRFFSPYQSLIAQVPFYPSLGNHDGNETESRGDLAAYLDNFFFPGGKSARYYRFSYGGLADFFALDSTTNSESGPPAPMYLAGGDQHKWALKNFGESKVPWKIPYFHNPPFNAGPRHPAAAADLAPFMDLFKKTGVKVVFTGHEHNFQFSRKNSRTGDIRYVVSGSGGELRTGDVRESMNAAEIEGWCAQLHFLSVEIQGKEMRIMPISFEPMRVVDADGRTIPLPLKVTIP